MPCRITSTAPALALRVTCGGCSDSSHAYGPFTNEEIVGKALRGRREHAFVSTKFGFRRSREGDWLGLDGSPEHVRTACLDSMRRLAVDHIDLYFLHCPDPAVPIE